MITPGDAARQNDEIHSEQLAAAEKAIDAVLSRSFSSGRSVSIEGKAIPISDYYLRKKLIDRYRKAGWKVEHTDSQREGSHYSFSAGPRS